MSFFPLLEPLLTPSAVSAGASCQRLGRYKEAIGYHETILKTSERAGDTSGDSEAYGAIADCYTELGDLEKAGKVGIAACLQY